MPLPDILDFVGTNVTQTKFQQAQANLLDYLDGEVPTKLEMAGEISKYVDQRVIDAKEYDQTFDTESELKKFIPTNVGFLAKAWDTRRVFRWIDDITGWKNLGLSEYELAVADREAVISENDDDDLRVPFLTEDRIEFAHVGLETSELSGVKIEKNNETEDIRFFDEFGFEVGFTANDENNKTSLNLINLDFIDFSKNIIGTTTYGQSLSDGIAASPVISTEQLYNNLMLSGGVRTKPNDVAYVANSFAQLIESNLESPVSGFVNELSAEITKKYPSVIFSGMSAGVSGQRIENLVKDTAIYSRYMQMITDTCNTAIGSGYSYAVYYVPFKQGETNYYNGQTNGVQSALSHAQALSKLIEDSAQDIAKITNQDFKPVWLMSQTASHRFYAQTSQWVAIAIWRVAQKVENAYLTYPDYFLPKAADKLHLTNESSWRSGQYDAMCALQMAHGKDWKPFHVKSVSWQSNVLILDCHVPVLPIQFSTTYTKQVQNQGFDIWENDALADIITSVEIIGELKDKIKITCSREPSANAKLRIGFGRDGDAVSNDPSTSGALTNVHDSNAKTVTSPLNNDFKLLNYLIIDEFSKELI